jgi:hypothetical protein
VTIHTCVPETVIRGGFGVQQLKLYICMYKTVNPFPINVQESETVADFRKSSIERRRKSRANNML